jgi:hypothetical protein
MESRDYAYFCSTVQNSEHFSPLRNASERSQEYTSFFCVAWYRIPSIFLRNGWERNFLLAALLLEGKLYLEAGVAPHHEEEAGVDVLQVRLVAPRHADHLSEC